MSLKPPLFPSQTLKRKLFLPVISRLMEQKRYIPHTRELDSESRSVVSDSLRPHGLYSPWNSPGQNTGVGSLCLLQGIFPTQGSNLGLPHCRQILYQLSHKASCPQGNSPVTVIIAHCIHSFIPELIHTLIQKIFSECPLSKL